MSSVKVNAMQMKIGQFTDTFLPIVDGVGRVVQAYSETLCRMGHQVTVVDRLGRQVATVAHATGRQQIVVPMGEVYIVRVGAGKAVVINLPAIGR